MTPAQAYRQPEAQNRIQIYFSGARSDFLSCRLRIELKFYSLKDVFLKNKKFRIVLNQRNQLLQARAYRQPEAQNRIQSYFSGAFRFPFMWTPNRTQKFYSLKDVFLKIEGFRIVLDQRNQPYND